MHRWARDAGRFGTKVDGVGLDWPTLVARQHAIVEQFQPSTDSFERKGVRVHLGEARFEDPHTLRVDGHLIHGDRILIAAGSEPVIPPVPGRELAITSNELLFVPVFPSRLLLIGSGVIALEMASAFCDLGAEVTVVGRETEILPSFDADVAAYLRAILEARGVTFVRGATLERLSRSGDEIAAHLAGSEIRATTVCFATGRRWRPAGLGADGLGLALGRLGLETTDDLRTSVDGIWAAGDAAGRMQLTPTAAYEGRLAARNAITGERTASDLSSVPQAVFTSPEIARVGLGHAEAQRRGFACHVSRHDMRGASNGVASGEDDGYLKLVFDESNERLLGVQMVSHAAAELIQLATLAIRMGATAGQLAAQLSVHPSHAERFIKVSAHEYHEFCEV